MKKHLTKLGILLLFVAALFALPMTTLAETSGTCGDNLTWVLDDEGTLTISGTGAMIDIWSAPWDTNVKDVKKVLINNGVTSIGAFAFGNHTNLTGIILPEGMTSIGDGAFEGCYKLTNITIPNSVTDIGQYAFVACIRLNNITIPNSVTNISAGTFSSCKSLTSITIPASVTNINREAFNNCSSLERITLPAALNNIGTDAFVGCDDLDIYISADQKPTYTLPSPLSESGTVYCYRSSEVDNWATENGYKIAYLDAAETSPESGDANQDDAVDITDALQILRYCAGQEDSINTHGADVNADGKVDQGDVLLLLQYSAGWNVELK